MELISIARKPISEKTIVDNILKWGTGGINIDDLRIPLVDGVDDSQLRTMNRNVRTEDNNNQTWGFSKKESDTPQVINRNGRYPSNFIYTDDEIVMNEFKKYGTKKSGKNCKRTKEGYFGVGDIRHGGLGKKDDVQITYGDEGLISRFFYCAKTSTKERNMSISGKKINNIHPTVKPIALMEFLCKLVTQENGIILDPFMGSGSTGFAAIKNNFKFIGIEKIKESYNISVNRLEYKEN